MNYKRDGTVTINSVGLEPNAMISSKVSKIRNGHTSPIKSQELLVLSQYAQSLNENDWKDFFLNCARGNIQKPLKYDIQSMTFTYKKKNQTYSFHVSVGIINELHTTYINCKAFISQILGFSSDTDEDDLIKNISAEPGEIFQWSGNIPIRQQIAYIEIFANKKSIEFNFTEQTRQDLVRTLIASITSKSIQNSDIIVSNYEILNINGLSFEQNSYNLFNTVKLQKKITNTPKQSVTVNILPCSKEISNMLKKIEYPEFINGCYDAK